VSERNENPNRALAPVIAVILAGGGARRMGGADKGEMRLGGKGLIEHVVERLAPQADQILISGRHDYGLGFAVIPDRDDGPAGPAAGLWAAARHIAAAFPETQVFATVPVDGPFVPLDLIAQLQDAGATAVAADEQNMHPTFALWRIATLLDARRNFADGEGVALHKLAKECGATQVRFPDGDAFINVNSPDDLETAEAILARKL